MSSQPKVFITGATGYIGGDAFHALQEAHPDWSFTCLVRNSDRGAKIAAKYPKTRLVYGALEDADLIQKEAADSDVILDCASADILCAAEAIAKGLQSPHSKTTHWIHVSGSGILLYPDIDEKTWGVKRDKVWDDVADIEGLISGLPDHAPHRAVDKAVIAANSIDGVKTAIVCPPTIFGTGRGPGNTRSIQVPGLARTMLLRGKGLKVMTGNNMWTEIHVHDLSDLFVKLAEAAVGGSKNPGWGSKGYYFAENGEFVWGDVSADLAKLAKKIGYIDTDGVDELPSEEIEELHKHGTFLWGANSRCVATRARQELGWAPTRPKLFDSFEEALKTEKRLIDEGHEVTIHV